MVLDSSKIHAQARILLADPFLMYRAGEAIGQLGVVGEQRNRLIVLLAGLTRELDDPVSVIIKGPSSSGKSNLLKTALQLFPPEQVLERASLSAKAPVHAEKSPAGKILYLQEYRGGKDAQLLLRLLQSEGRITHEYASVIGKSRGTQLAEQVGSPVVLTTTTDERVYPDDETRFLSIWVDESPAQTLAIAKSQVRSTRTAITPRISVWREALRLVRRTERDFLNPPGWLTWVAGRLPSDKVRVRRDFKRALSFCSAIALLSRAGIPGVTNISFEDYAAAYRILEPALAATAHSAHPQELAAIRAVEILQVRLNRGVAAREIAGELGWNESLVYKWLRIASEHKRIAFEPGTRARNQKLIVPVTNSCSGFLPSPSMVLKNNPKIGTEAEFVDPLTGVPTKIRTLSRVGN